MLWSDQEGVTLECELPCSLSYVTLLPFISGLIGTICGKQLLPSQTVGPGLSLCFEDSEFKTCFSLSLSLPFCFSLSFVLLSFLCLSFLLLLFTSLSSSQLSILSITLLKFTVYVHYRKIRDMIMRNPDCVLCTIL